MVILLNRLLIDFQLQYLFLALLLLTVPAQAVELVTEQEQEQEQEQKLLEEGEPVDDHWLDVSHDYVSDQADELAQWLDSFFGQRVADIESARSILRLTSSYNIDEIDDDEFKLRGRGKLQLPALSERLSLVFSGSEGEDSDRIQTARDDESDDGQVALQYSVQETPRHKFDLFGGVRAGLKARAGLRYRYQYTPSASYFHRFRQQLAYDQSDRAISTTRLDLSYKLDHNSLWRWSSRVRYGEETDGVEWRSSVGWQERLAPNRAVTYFVGINGITDPDKLIKSYGPGIRYRQTVFRDYLFLDLVPSYSWRKEEAGYDREGAWSFDIQLEMFFEN
jgi:hypothetical protein